ncbi:MAG TPA: hypothetical protein VFQ57_02285 [Sphingomonas sp.]|jgi:hypothetical protein|nr:hypothetical protein [Sphingomonas sp.]
MLMFAGEVAMHMRDPNYGDGTEAWINPIFIVPGSVSQPDFDGYEYGHFSRKRKGLVIKIAVPRAVARGKGVPEFISSSLRDAVHMASEFFSVKGISFSTLKAEQIILAIEAGLARSAG